MFKLIYDLTGWDLSGGNPPPDEKKQERSFNKILQPLHDEKKQERSDVICNMVNLMKKVNTLPNTSASESIQCLVDFKDGKFNPMNYNVKKAFIKLFDKNSKDYENGGLEYEQTVYDLVSLLVYSNSSPMFVRYLGKLDNNCNFEPLLEKCKKDIQKKIKRSRRTEFIQDMKLTESKLQNMENKIGLMGIVTEAVNGRDFYSTVESASIRLSQTDLKLLCLQTLIGIYQMEILSLTHQDMHLGNIMVEEYKEPRTNIYVIENKKPIKITSRFQVKLFDWDRGYSNMIGTNKLLYGNLCKEANQCNEFVKGKDTLQFLCHIHDYMSQHFKMIYEKNDTRKKCMERCLSVLQNERDKLSEDIKNSIYSRVDSGISKKWIEQNCQTFNTLDIIFEVIETLRNQVQLSNLQDGPVYFIESKSMKDIIENKQSKPERVRQLIEFQKINKIMFSRQYENDQKGNRMNPTEYLKRNYINDQKGNMIDPSDYLKRNVKRVKRKRVSPKQKNIKPVLNKRKRTSPKKNVNPVVKKYNLRPRPKK